MRQYHFLLGICFWFTLFLPITALPFSFTGHVLLSQIAYDNLSSSARVKADRLAAQIWKQLSSDMQVKLDKQYSQASTFAKIAMLPDKWRKWHVGTIFRDFNASVPSNLLPYTDEKIQGWHFINLPYPITTCQTIKPHNITWAIPVVEQSLRESHDENQQAVLMVLLEHLVGDSEQPLHAISRVNTACQDDKGGNQFCLRINNRGRCTKNLHSLWDNAVGYLKPHQNILRSAYRLEKRYPQSQFASLLQNTSPLNWVQTNLGFANFIYQLPENEKPSPVYYREGQAIATSQLTLAGYRLATILNALLTAEPTKG